MQLAKKLLYKDAHAAKANGNSAKRNLPYSRTVTVTLSTPQGHPLPQVMPYGRLEANTRYADIHPGADYKRVQYALAAAIALFVTSS